MLMWEDTDAYGVHAKCEYEPMTGIYTVAVSKGVHVRSESFGQTFTPTFGMDTADVHQMAEIAEKLAVEIDKLVK